MSWWPFSTRGKHDRDNAKAVFAFDRPVHDGDEITDPEARQINQYMQEEFKFPPATLETPTSISFSYQQGDLDDDDQ